MTGLMSRTGLAAVMMAGGLTLAPAAFGEGWSIDALDPEASTASCMAKAEAVFRRYASMRPVGNILNTEWTVYAYEIGGQGIDTIVMCRTDAAGNILPYLVTHSDDRRDGDRDGIHNLLRDLWSAPK